MLQTVKGIPALKDPTLMRQQAYVNGAWVGANSSFDVTNPADGAKIASVPNMGEQETLAAIEAARVAFPAWAARPAKERSRILRNWFDLMLANADDLATLMTTEQGKPLTEAKAEVLYGANFIEWFAEEAKRVDGDVLAAPSANRRLLVLKQPVGVCASITPWNFPMAMITRKVAPAIAAGCTIVIKPAEQTPLSALALAELAHRAGFPPGVVNVITADAANSVEVGKVLCASTTVRHLSFTGSTGVGRILMQQCAPTIKKLSLELGGHAPFIVFEDADLDAAVDGALQSKYRNAGQTCISANRIYVHESVYREFVEKLAAASAKLKVGSGFDAGVYLGPLIDAPALEKVERQVADALAKGAKVATGGALHALGGHFYQPTVLSDVSSDMQIMHEETFGPVAAVASFKTEQEAVAAANDTEFGLAGYFYARDVGRIWRVAEQLEYGMIGVNTGAISSEVAPFGGIKQSGLGREGSKYGIEEYLEMKFVCMGGI